MGIGDDQSGREVAATEVTSGCETIANGEKIGKSGREGGGGGKLLPSGNLRVSK